MNEQPVKQKHNDNIVRIPSPKRKEVKQRDGSIKNVYATKPSLVYVFAIQTQLQKNKEVVVKGLGMAVNQLVNIRSEERRVGKECRSRWSPYH